MELIPLMGFKDKKRGYYKIQEDAKALGHGATNVVSNYVRSLKSPMF